MDIVKTVAEAIEAIPGQPSTAEIARIAIEEYQKALWTPYFSLGHRGMMMPERRRHWANALTAHIMDVVGKYLDQRTDGARNVSADLFERLYESGAYIVTDADRSEAGLSPRGAYGLTLEEIKIMEAKHIQAMLQPMPPLILKRDVS